MPPPRANWMAVWFFVAREAALRGGNLALAIAPEVNASNPGVLPRPAVALPWRAVRGANVGTALACLADAGNRCGPARRYWRAETRGTQRG